MCEVKATLLLGTIPARAAAERNASKAILPSTTMTPRFESKRNSASSQGSAVTQFLRRRFILPEPRTANGADPEIGQLHSIMTIDGIRLRCKSSYVQSRIQDAQWPITGKRPSQSDLNHAPPEQAQVPEHTPSGSPKEGTGHTQYSNSACARRRTRENVSAVTAQARAVLALDDRRIEFVQCLEFPHF